MTPLLTIMLPTTIDRRPLFEKLLEEVARQCEPVNKDKMLVEVVIMEDNKEISVGMKRQRLLQSASGLYVVGIDSDDWIAPDYVEEIINVITSNPSIDHVGFWEHCTIDDQVSMSIFSIEHKEWGEMADGTHIRCANPKSVILREKALAVGFEDSRYGEDRVFSEKVTALCRTEVFIDKVLYYYRHISSPHNERYGIKTESHESTRTTESH